jgi:hypothetical protein
MQKEKIKTLRRHLKQVGKFARQRAALSPSTLEPIPEPPETIDLCHEQQMALNGALSDIDSAIEALDAALLTAAERLEALDACRSQNPA